MAVNHGGTISAIDFSCVYNRISTMCYFGEYSHIFHYLHQKHCIVMLEVLIKDVVPVNHEIVQTLVRVLINNNLITIGPNLNHRQSNANIERTIKLKGNNINTFWKYVYGQVVQQSSCMKLCRSKPEIRCHEIHWSKLGNYKMPVKLGET